MSEVEKKAYPEHEKIGGFLKKYSYKEAFQKSWKNTSKEDREKILLVPNFDNDIFLEISGIDVVKEFKESSHEW